MSLDEKIKRDLRNEIAEKATRISDLERQLAEAKRVEEIRLNAWSEAMDAANAERDAAIQRAEAAERERDLMREQRDHQSSEVERVRAASVRERDAALQREAGLKARMDERDASINRILLELTALRWVYEAAKAVGVLESPDYMPSVPNHHWVYASKPEMAALREALAKASRVRGGR